MYHVSIVQLFNMLDKGSHLILNPTLSPHADIKFLSIAGRVGLGPAAYDRESVTRKLSN